MAKNKQMTTREEWPEVIGPKDLPKLMPGIIGMPKAYKIFKSNVFPVVKMGNRMVCRSEDFWTWWDAQLEPTNEWTAEPLLVWNVLSTKQTIDDLNSYADFDIQRAIEAKTEGRYEDAARCLAKAVDSIDKICRLREKEELTAD